MLLTITSTAHDATDLGFLLHKHPGKVQSFALPVGTAFVFYPEAGVDRCTAALLLEVDPVGLVRGKRFGGTDAFSLAQYVNDRPYAASSMVAVALARVFRTAMSGRCDARPDLAQQGLPLEIRVPALPARGGVDVVARLFGPLGWQVDATPVPLDPQIAAWGRSRYVDLRLRGTVRLADALNHLYVLLPVLDDAKHYWVGSDEVDKLLRAGDGWLAAHPDRDLIMRRYLAHRREYVTTAVGRLAEVDDTEADVLDNAVPDDAVPTLCRPKPSRRTTQRRRTRDRCPSWSCAGLPSSRPSKRPARSGSWTSAAGRARCCGCSRRTRHSARWSGPTCPPGPSTSRTHGSTWTGWASASATGSGCSSRR